MMTKVPDVIFLQNADAGFEATWCAERIDDDDVQYVRCGAIDADTARARAIARAVQDHLCSGNVLSLQDFRYIVGRMNRVFPDQADLEIEALAACLDLRDPSDPVNR